MEKRRRSIFLYRPQFVSRDDVTPNRSERGSNLIEYTLLVGLIALVCFAAVTFIGQQPAPRLEQLGSTITRN